MTHQDLIQDVKRRLRYDIKISDRDMNLILSAMTQSITDALSKGEKVKLRYLGTLQTKKREARMQNIAGRGMMQLPEKIRVTFSPSEKLTDAVNKHKT